MKNTAPSGELSLVQKLRGHYRTLQPFFARSLRPLPRPATKHWSYEFASDIGPVQLTGQLLERSAAEVVVVLHGLGGSTDSGYMALILAACDQAGKSCLLLNCRGADRLGSDIYHSGLREDIEHALSSPAISRYSRVLLFGYSIGGHIALKYCTGEVDPRVTRVAAIGSPLDLRAAADDFDAASFNVYRGHVLDALKEIYTAAYQRRPDALSPLEARKIQRIRDWDEAIIAPRFGFASADDYYEKESVGPILDQLHVEALYVGAPFDPMVLRTSVEPHLASERIEVVWDESAGHLGFGPDFHMNMPGQSGLEPQVLTWLSR